MHINNMAKLKLGAEFSRENIRNFVIMANQFDLRGNYKGKQL